MWNIPKGLESFSCGLDSTNGEILHLTSFDCSWSIYWYYGKVCWKLPSDNMSCTYGTWVRIISFLSAKWDQPVWEQVFPSWLYLESLILDGQLHIISLFVFFLHLQSSSQQEIYWAAKLWSSNWLRRNLNEFLNIQLKSIVTLFILGPRQIEIETINGSTSFWKNEG